MAHLFGEVDPVSPYLLARRKFYKPEDWDKMLDVLNHSCTLYVGNLSRLTEEEQIRCLFSRCDRVKRVIMGVNRETFEPCGFCFVEYYFHSSAQRAVACLNGTKLDEKNIRVDLDPGFEQGRQFGRGETGGQFRDDIRRRNHSRGRFRGRGGYRGRGRGGRYGHYSGRGRHGRYDGHRDQRFYDSRRDYARQSRDDRMADIMDGPPNSDRSSDPNSMIDDGRGNGDHNPRSSSRDRDMFGRLIQKQYRKGGFQVRPKNAPPGLDESSEMVSQPSDAAPESGGDIPTTNDDVEMPETDQVSNNTNDDSSTAAITTDDIPSAMDSSNDITEPPLKRIKPN